MLIRFRKGQKVRDKRDGRIGKVQKSARRFVLVVYPEQCDFMSMEVGYRKNAELGNNLEHYSEYQNAQSDR